jgi:hypothetical protein
LTTFLTAAFFAVAFLVTAFFGWATFFTGFFTGFFFAGTPRTLCPFPRATNFATHSPHKFLNSSQQCGR